MGGREVYMINTLSKMNLSKTGWEGGESTSIWIMSAEVKPSLTHLKLSFIFEEIVPLLGENFLVPQFQYQISQT